MENAIIKYRSDDRLTYDKGPKTYLLDGKIVNQIFNGVVCLDNDLTHYMNYTVTTNIACTLDDNPIIGGSAEIRMIGDGTYTPTFSSDFTKSTSSADFDPTVSAINKVIFYYDGTEVFYSITIL